MDGEIKKSDFNVDVYKELIDLFDATACESIAINQFTAGRLVDPHIGYGSYIFTRLCIHSESLLRAAPMSRWSKSDFQFWDLSCIASHVRAIMEGFLFYMYISESPASDDEWKARLWTMHMNDCMKRLKFMQLSNNLERVNFFDTEKEKIKNNLNENPYFSLLPSSIKKGCLNGKFLMINTRDELIDKYGIDKNSFDILFDILSHYTHILPISYYSHEQERRGSGLFNETDLGYLCMCLGVVHTLMEKCNERVIGFFPDAESCRRGVKSIFSPGPKGNLPQLEIERQNRNNKKRKKK